MKQKTKNLTYLAVFAIGIIISVILTSSYASYCDTENTCNNVTSSLYGSTLGVKNSTLGIFIFAALILVVLWQMSIPSKIKQRIINTGVIVGSLIAIYFIYLQQFVLNSWCRYCLVIDIALIIALIVLLIPEEN